MRLLEYLESLGDKLGILEKGSGASSLQGSPRVPTRSVTLAELSSEIRAEEVRALADLPAELAVPFEKIFESAAISKAAHGWTIERLGLLLRSDPFKNLERDAVQERILSLLRSEGVEVEDLVRDAVARDRALDAFEQVAQKKMLQRMAVRKRSIVELEEKMAGLRKARSRLEEQMNADRETWREWRGRKRILEQDLARAVGYLIDRQVITTGDEEP